MNSSNRGMTRSAKPLVIVVALIAAVALLATLAVLYVLGWLPSLTPNRQAQIHAAGAQIMPFDLDATTHTFTMTPTGGIQEVTAKDPGDSTQIALIQQHLQHEAMQFRAGDFSDPASLHGADMPGLKALEAGAAQVRVEYATLPAGARLIFTTDDPQLITAVHQWFGAQLSDHGHDAMSK